MRILMTTDVVGGVWTYTQELVQGLLDVDDAVRVALVTLGGTPTREQSEWLGSRRTTFGRRFTFESTNFPLEWQLNNGTAFSDAAPVIRGVAAGFRPEIFHTNQFCFGGLELGCPTVVVAHSDVLSWHKAVRGRACDESPWMDQYLTLLKGGLAGSRVVVAPSQVGLDDLQREFGPFEKTRVIPNGRTVFPPRVPKKLQAVTAGRVWDEAKGMAVLEELMSPMPILIAGETQSPEASYDANRLRRRVLLGRLTDAATAELFAESAVYIITSLYEPFGLSAVEAAQCGCAIVSRDIPAQREVWGNDAIFFRDAAGLRAALVRLAEDENYLHEAGERAAKRAKAKYSRGTMVAAYRGLYAELLQGAEAGHGA